MKKHDNTNMVLRYLLGFENTEKRFENLVEFLTKTGIHRVILFTAPFVETSSILPIDYYKRHSQMLAPYIKKLRELNIEVGINSLFTVGHCYYADEDEFGFKRAVTVNGEASRGCVCMHADGFDEYLREEYRCYAELKPSYIFLDDDTANEITQFALQRITKQIKTLGVNGQNPWNIVVWNLNDSDYNGYIEAEVQWLHEFPAYSGGILLEDENQKQYKCQKILEKSVIEDFRSRFVFKAEIPAFGYKSFKVIKTETDEKIIQNSNIKAISTEAFDILLNESTGLIESVTEKASGRKFNNIFIPAVFEDNGDTWCFDVDSYGKRLEDFKNIRYQVTENGALRTTIKTQFTFRNSLLTLYYIFYNKENYFDIKYSANWNEAHTVLKLISNVGYEDLTVSSPFSVEHRKDTDYDVPMGEWLTVSGKYGAVSYIADSLFSYSKKEAELSLSVLRSCIYGDLRMKYVENHDYPIMEQGICEGNLRIVLHKDTPFADNIPQIANSFNNPVIVICDANHNGSLPPTDSYISVSDSYVSAVKQAEDATGDIIRLVELEGKEKDINIRYFENEFSVSLSPYEIKTVKINGNSLIDVYITED